MYWSVIVSDYSGLMQALPFEECDCARARAPSFAFGRAIFHAPERWNFFKSRFIFRLNTILYAA